MSEDVVSLRHLVRSGDDTPDGASVHELVASNGFDRVWSEFRDIQRELDERWRKGSVPAERMVEVQSRLLGLARELCLCAIEEEVQAYRQFLRDVSHDIRSPLHSIIFLTEALHSSRPDDRPKAEQRQLGTIYAAGTSLLNLVNDLLDYTRIQGGEVEEVSEYAFSVSSVLSDVQQLLGPLLEHRGTELRVRSGEGERFVGDPHLLNRVLTNLVSNAVEAAGDDGRVAVRLERRDGGLLGEVWDDGSDVDVEKLRSLLTIPADDASMTRVRRELDGSVHGLGLLICSRLVRQVEGWIDVEEVASDGGRDASMDGGTRFAFWLPFTAVSSDG